MIKRNITIQDLSRMPFDEIIGLYKKGYEIPIEKSSIKSLATCPSSIVQGTTKSVTITPNGGTPPYKIELLVDGSSAQTQLGATGAYTFYHTFNESIGSHTFGSRVTDSCAAGAKVYSEPPCTISITAPAPVCPTNLSAVLSIPQ